MVEVFKTNVQETEEVKQITQLLLEHFPDSHINFDLDDCDKILRIESSEVKSEKVISILSGKGVFCEILPD